MKLITYSGFPLSVSAVPGSGWQYQLDRYPDYRHASHNLMVTNGAVANPNFSAPAQAMATVTSGHQLTICLQNHFITESVHDQSLMSSATPKFPRKSRIVNGVSWSCSMYHRHRRIPGSPGHQPLQRRLRRFRHQLPIPASQRSGRRYSNSSDHKSTEPGPQLSKYRDAVEGRSG